MARRTGKDVNSHTVLDGIITTIMATIQRINIIGSREGSRNRRRLKANQTGKKFRVGIKSNISTNRNNLIRVRNIRALNGRFNTSITHAYSIVIGSKHITLNATGGGFLTASKQFRHGATSKSRSNTASNSTKHKSPHLSGWRQII